MFYWFGIPDNVELSIALLKAIDDQLPINQYQHNQRPPAMPSRIRLIMLRILDFMCGEVLGFELLKVV